MTAPAIAALDVAAARAATDRLRLTLTDAHEQLIELYRMRAHETLGYGKRLAGWTAYLEAEFGELLHVVPSPDQLAAMVDAGMSQREAAAPFRVSLGTVNAALQTRRAGNLPAAGGLGGDRVVPDDGKISRPSKVARILAAIDAAGDAGLDVRAVCRKAKLPRESVSPALCRLAASGRLAYRPPAKRGQVGTYAVSL